MEARGEAEVEVVEEDGGSGQAAMELGVNLDRSHSLGWPQAGTDRARKQLKSCIGRRTSDAYG